MGGVAGTRIQGRSLLPPPPASDSQRDQGVWHLQRAGRGPSRLVPPLSGPKCAATTVDVVGCLNVIVNVTTRSNDGEAAFHIRGSCPLFGVNQSGLQSDEFYSFTVCLAPGTYTFVMVDAHGDGSEGGTFSVELDGSATPSVKYDPLIPATEVAGFGLQATFLVPSGMLPQFALSGGICTNRQLTNGG